MPSSLIYIDVSSYSTLWCYLFEQALVQCVKLLPHLLSVSVKQKYAGQEVVGERDLLEVVLVLLYSNINNAKLEERVSKQR